MNIGRTMTLDEYIDWRAHGPRGPFGPLGTQTDRADPDAACASWTRDRHGGAARGSMSALQATRSDHTRRALLPPLGSRLRCDDAADSTRGSLRIPARARNRFGRPTSRSRSRSLILRGVVRHYDRAKRFGKIAARRVDYFVNVEDLVDVLVLEPGQHVVFEAVDSNRGPRAVKVRPMEP